MFMPGYKVKTSPHSKPHLGHRKCGGHETPLASFMACLWHEAVSGLRNLYYDAHGNHCGSPKCIQTFMKVYAGNIGSAFSGLGMWNVRETLHRARIVVNNERKAGFSEIIAMSRQSVAPQRNLSLTEELEKLEQSITLTLQGKQA